MNSKIRKFGSKIKSLNNEYHHKVVVTKVQRWQDFKVRREKAKSNYIY